MMAESSRASQASSSLLRHFSGAHWLAEALLGWLGSSRESGVLQEPGPAAVPQTCAP